MWILPKQLLTSAYVLDTKELGLDSEEFSQISEKSLMWRSKPSLSRTWLQRWKRNSWIQRLSTRILKPSLTENFVERWTSSQADSLVSHSALQESVKQLMTQDTCSHSSQMESESANLELFSSRTYKESLVAKQVTENQFSNMSLESWNKWVTEQRQEYSQRKKLALLTKENESSSWATPQAFDHVNIVRTPEKLAKTRAEKNAGCMNLREQVHYPNMDHSRKTAQNWPTIQASEARQGYQDRTNGKKGSQKSLTTVVIDGHQDQAKLNTNGKSKGSLNPNWVEQLMGLPVGWTQLPTEWTD
jgi:hypothetical protein